MVSISTLRPGDDLAGVFACVRKDRLTTRTGAPYLVLELRDRTGTIPARAFRDADVLAGGFERGDLVRVAGRVERFRDELVVEVSEINFAGAPLGRIQLNAVSGSPRVADRPMRTGSHPARSRTRWS